MPYTDQPFITQELKQA